MFLDSRDQRALASYAFILNNIDSNHSLIGQFIPFVLAVLKKQQDKKIDPFPMSELIKKQFGFEIPRLAMLSIIDQAKKLGLIYKQSDQFLYPTQEALNNTHIEENSKLFQQKQEEIITDFINFTQKTEQYTLNKETANEQFSLFFQKNALPFLLTHDSQINEYSFSDIPNDKLYFFHKYIIHLDSTHNVDFLKHITDIAFGYILTSLILKEGEDKPLTPQLKGIQIFLDTPIIIRLLGLEGNERRLAQEELITMLRKEGAVLLLLQHTYKEITNILFDVSQKISNIPSNITPLGKTLSYCLQLGLTKGDIESQIATFPTFLKNNEISVVDITYTREENQQYNIDHIRLEQTIKEVYGVSSSPEMVQTRENAIALDVKSIAEVYTRRKNRMATDISNSISFLLTANTGLVLSARKYMREQSNATRAVPSCLTDSFVTTVLWSKSPNTIYRLNEKKMISDCYAAVMPDESTLKKFLTRVEKLKKEGKITQNMYQLRMYKVTQELLYTKNHTEELTEETPDTTIIEILAGVQQKAEQDALNKFTQKEQELKRQLKEYKEKIENTTQQNMNLNFKLSQEKEKQDKRIQSRRSLINSISRIVFYIYLVLGISIIIYIFIFGNKLRSILDIVFLVIGGSLLGWGHKIRKKIEQKLNELLIQKDLF